MTEQIYICDVAPRDGLQNEARFVPTEDKIALIDWLSESGVDAIEATSFTSPKAIPALADATEVMAGIRRNPAVQYAALVPNGKGCERALASKVDVINLVMSASVSHSLANLRRLPSASLEGFRDIVGIAKGKAAINLSISTSFGCPFEGAVPESTLFGHIEAIANLGITQVTLCDTTGMANPRQVAQIFIKALANWPGLVFTAHFHDTRGMGLVNVVAALGAGIRRFDASLAGIGGCPYAPGASGNVCTEDLVHMLLEIGYSTNARLSPLLTIAGEVPRLIGRDVCGAVRVAGPVSLLHPFPAQPGE